MLFNSYEFILVFLPLALLSGLLCKKYGGDKSFRVFLSIASFLFLYLNDHNSIYVLATSVIVNYFFSAYVPSRYLALPILLNLVILALFKYLQVWTSSGFAIPLGISFYTFQQIGYLIDCSESKSQKLSFIDYVLATVFFPKLLAGPILQTGELVQKFQNIALFNQGIFIFSIGLFKKVVFADGLLANLTSKGFFAVGNGIIPIWVMAVAFTLHLYFDFSGYCDMAVGLAKMFGFEIPWNFNAPFKSRSLVEFWSRWHISLGDFVRTYFFTWQLRKHPGNFAYQMFILFLTMVLLGLWHGGTWNYLIFGAMHGLGLVCNYSFRRANLKLWPFLSQGLTFLFVVLSMVVFHAVDLSEVLRVLYKMVDFGSFQPRFVFKKNDVATLIAGLMIFVFMMPSAKVLAEKFHASGRTLLFTVALMLISLLSLRHETQFVYLGF